MQGYEHGGDIYTHDGIRLDFSANINPLGMPPEVSRAVAESVEGYDIYPDPHCRQLVSAIAKREHVPCNWVLCGNGAADLIFRLMYSIRPGRVVVCAPTFSEYEKAAMACGAKVARHMLNEDSGFRLEEDILDNLQPGDMLVLCNPNNPTGLLADNGLLQSIVKACGENGLHMLVDECFLSFTGGASLKPLLAGNKRLFILKAFTKMYAMAGLRLGYMLCSDAAALEGIYKAGQSWPVSTPAQVAGLAALGCERWEEDTRDLVRAEREYMTDGLKKLGLDVFKSDVNYILFKCDKPLYCLLLERGILIRSCHNYNGLGEGYYRIGLKCRAENEKLLEAIAEVLNG